MCRIICNIGQLLLFYTVKWDGTMRPLRVSWASSQCGGPRAVPWTKRKPNGWL